MAGRAAPVPPPRSGPASWPSPTRPAPSHPQGLPGQRQSPVYNLPSSDFHDVTTGSNGHSAGKGATISSGPPQPHRQPRRFRPCRPVNGETHAESRTRSGMIFPLRVRLCGSKEGSSADSRRGPRPGPSEDGHEDVLGHHEGQDGRDGPEVHSTEGGEHGDGAGQDLQQPANADASGHRYPPRRRAVESGGGRAGPYG